MIKLKTVTESSWLIVGNEDEEPIGLLSYNPNDTYYMLYDNKEKKFKNKTEVIDYFQYNIFNNIVEDIIEAGKENFVRGYPVELPEIYQVDKNALNLPVYRKTEKSDIWHCAGYYCIKYNKGWLPNYCPKYSTLEKYEFEGPFKTEAEMKTRLSTLRKQWKRR